MVDRDLPRAQASLLRNNTHLSYNKTENAVRIGTTEIRKNFDSFKRLAFKGLESGTTRTIDQDSVLEFACISAGIVHRIIHPCCWASRQAEQSSAMSEAYYS